MKITLYTSLLIRRLEFLLIGATTLVCFAGYGQATDLIISEYVEGSGNNKYIEVYNGTGALVNLTDYQLRLYANGSAVPTNTHALTGTLASGAVVVYRNTSATIYGGATVVSAAVNFNGDDAIALYKVSTASFVDIVGNIGCDPGTQWSGGGNTTQDQTLVRNVNICAGITTDDPTICPFPALASQWTAYPIDNVANLGSHTMTCAATVSFATASSTDPESVGTVTVNLNISPAPTAPGTVTITIANGTGVTYPGDYTTTPAGGGGTFNLPIAVGQTAASFNINVVDDPATEPTEDITFTISGVTGGMFIGGANTYVQYITNNDFTPTINFTTLNITVLENAGVQNFQLSINPAATVPGTITINITNGPGAAYTGDYTTNPAGGGGTISIPVVIGQTTANFTVTLVNDAVPESNETVTFTLTGVPPGAAIGSSTNSQLVIGDDDNPPAVLNRADLAIVAVNANNFACSGSSGEDEVSFFAFKDITPGTQIYLTDNGYERCNAGLWGDTEGIVRLQRTGPTITAGTVITVRIASVSGPGNIIGITPDASWTCTSIIPAASVNMNVGGDQLFFAQGGIWINPGAAHDINYTGTILYGFSSNGTWVAQCPSPAGNQNSNLPLQMECYSMAPTSTSDFSKYTGPTSSTDQRTWIIRIGDPANWTGYVDCATYASSGPNYVGGYTFNFTTIGFTPGLWTGAVSTDWFDCRNWNDAQVPIATTDVTINSTAFRSCLVGAGGAAVCDDLAITLTGTNRELTINGASSLTMGGTLTIDQQATGQAGATVTGGSTLTCGGITMQGPAAGLVNTGRLLNDDPASLVVVNGDVLIQPGGFLRMQGIGVGGVMEVRGDFNNQHTEVAFTEINSHVTFNGSGLQAIMGIMPERFGRLTVNKPVGDLEIDIPIIVRVNLDLLNGRIVSPTFNKVTMNDNATATNASDASHVDGPVEKIGDDAFTFPVGDLGEYRPLSITGLVAGTTEAFTCDHTFGDPSVIFNNVLDPTLHHISHCEYWLLERATGSPDAFVTLTWDNTSCGVTLLPDLRIARWDGAVWRDMGNGGTTGNITAGSIITPALVTQFSPFTLASITSENPLPIELLWFNAHATGDRVQVDWATASERDNAYFTIERSRDGSDFQAIGEVAGAGNSNSTLYYGFIDPVPLPGLSYYRLMQTDIDGTYTYSAVKSVRFDDGDTDLLLIVGQDLLTVQHNAPAGTAYRVYDSSGRQVVGGLTTGTGRSEVPIAGLERGIYFFELLDGRSGQVGKFLK